MASGKTTEGQRIKSLYGVRNLKGITLMSTINKRDSQGRIKTHDGASYSALFVTDLADVSQDILDTYSVIVIDEAHWFDDLVCYCLKWFEEYHKHVIVVSLNADHKREKFGHVSELSCKCTDSIMLKGICSFCEKETAAPYSKLLKYDTTEQTVIGGLEIYRPVCWEHYQMSLSELSKIVVNGEQVIDIEEFPSDSDEIPLVGKCLLCDAQCNENSQTCGCYKSDLFP